MSKQDITNVFKQNSENNIYQQIFNNAIDAMVLFDEGGNVIQANDAFNELVHSNKKFYNTLNIKNLISGEDKKFWEVFTSGIEKQGKSCDFVISLQTKSGKKHVKINAHVVTCNSDSYCIFAVLHDITDLKNLENSLLDKTLLLENQIRAKAKELWIIQAGFVETISTLAEYRDMYTGQHLERIANYVGILAEELSKSSPYASYIKKKKHFIKDLVFASVMHDIGKTAIPDDILLKPTLLTQKEWDIMKTHTSVAGDILKREENKFKFVNGNDNYLTLATEIIYHHHERWDGSGYPDGLKGAEIPLSARIIALADVYDALTSERPYKKKWEHDRAAREIISNRAIHFDPHVVDAFIKQQEIFKLISN